MTYAWCGCLALSGFNEYGFTSKAANFFQNEGLEFFVIKNAVVDGEVVVRVLEMDSDSPSPWACPCSLHRAFASIP